MQEWVRGCGCLCIDVVAVVGWNLSDFATGACARVLVTCARVSVNTCLPVTVCLVVCSVLCARCWWLSLA
eukprot:m.230345 g.230345  ORF g.230345 m.230345 type:complete len:70 (-) comp18858_c2_seq1:347-556(-)